jgi:hypothetical protein
LIWALEAKVGWRSTIHRWEALEGSLRLSEKGSVLDIEYSPPIKGSVLDIVYSPPSFLRRYKRWFR